MNNQRYSLGNKIKVENVKSLNYLKNVNPKYAEHMYYKNRVVEAFAMSHFGGVDILFQPMCGKCEQPGFNTENPNFISTGDAEKDRDIVNCYCPRCGTSTMNTLTFRDYLMQELKMPIEDLKIMENMMNEKETNVC